MFWYRLSLPSITRSTPVLEVHTLLYFVSWPRLIQLQSLRPDQKAGQMGVWWGWLMSPSDEGRGPWGWRQAAFPDIHWPKAFSAWPWFLWSGRPVGLFSFWRGQAPRRKARPRGYCIVSGQGYNNVYRRGGNWDQGGGDGVECWGRDYTKRGGLEGRAGWWGEPDKHAARRARCYRALPPYPDPSHIPFPPPGCRPPPPVPLSPAPCPLTPRPVIDYES